MSTHTLTYDTTQPCVEFRFDRVGDGTPIHEHPKGQEHDTLCVKGRVSVVHAGGAILLKEGETARFDSTRPHAVTALEPDSAILNIYVNKPPPGFKAGSVDEYDLFTLGKG